MALKLITEFHDFSDFTVLKEAEKGPYAGNIIKFRGPFVRSDLRNKNKRLYPHTILTKAVEQYTNEWIKPRRALGELGHPEGVIINPDRASHVTESMVWDGCTCIGTAEVLDNIPMGKILAGLLERKIVLGVSSRGLGELSEAGKDGPDVTEYYMIAEDVVADPSTPDAFVNGVQEDREYIMEGTNIISVEKAYGRLDRTLSKLPKKDRKDFLLEAIRTFLAEI